MQHPQAMIKRFLDMEAAGGVVLFWSAVLAMLWVNSPLAYLHQQFLDHYLFMINDGLMAFFFLLVGLELKREFQSGECSSLAQIALPIVAALGGMIAPAAIYAVLNYHSPDTLVGWATPVATDIAFALGVLSLFGRRIPAGLRWFLLALAIFDDIGAILIIALFYSHGLAPVYLLLSLASVFLLYLLNRYSVKSLWPFWVVGLVLWYGLLQSGIHPTLAGVVLALFLPDGGKVEDALHPWVTFLVMPIFALANAGFPLAGMMDRAGSTVVSGVVLGLFLGKQLGVFGSAWLLIRMKFASLPERCSWQALYGVSLLCGIGFTMSLFLGTLSFQEDSIRLVDVRLGVLVGSILSGVAGALVLLRQEKPH